MSLPSARDPHALTPLPDFCGLPVLFALLLVSGLVTTVMLLAPGSRLDAISYAVATLFAVWLAMVCGVGLCKLRPRLERLAPLPAYAAVWLSIVLAVLLASAVVLWIDRRLGTQLTPDDSWRFVVGNAAIAALVGAALLRYFYVLAQWQERLQAASRAQVDALQARIRPHFLFNSMNTVAALVRVDPAAAERTVENLSELFRAALGADERPGTLGEELELIDRYLAIEQLRLGDRLRIRRDTAAAPCALPLPRLLLQPLVENAVHHGIHGCRAGGELGLAVSCHDDMVEIEIDNPLADDGRAPHRGQGHALDNVRRRLAYHYGDRGLLDAGISGGRYRVRVLLPARP
ncbi:MAG TPA: histidine kinase [Rhodanobacteraceae bacterium]|nr:histidine kinase [Rhodanobacteraceae bacterium]